MLVFRIFIFILFPNILFVLYKNNGLRGQPNHSLRTADQSDYKGQIDCHASPLRVYPTADEKKTVYCIHCIPPPLHQYYIYILYAHDVYIVQPKYNNRQRSQSHSGSSISCRPRRPRYPNRHCFESI